MKTAKIKEPVKIRCKNLAGGNKSIYLDIYQKGRRNTNFFNCILSRKHVREIGSEMSRLSLWRTR